MPIEVICPSCTRQFRVPDKVAGKRIKCPKCAGVLPVPGPAGSGTDSAVGGGSFVGGSTKKWYLKTPDGSQYGPVPKPELDQWLAEGRITADCQLLEEGSPQWQWSTDLYPQLDATAGTTSQMVASSSVPMQSPTQTTGNDPFAGLGGNDSASADNPFAALGAESRVSAAAPSGGAVNPAGGTVGGGDPFSFAGADTSPTSRVRGGKRVGIRRRKGGGSGKRGGAVTAVAIVNYILGALGVVFGLLVALLGSVVMGMFMGAVQGEMANSGDPNAAEAAQALGVIGSFGTAIFVIGGIVIILFYSLSLIAGYGVQIRAQWGRILTFILGGLNVLAGLVTLLGLSPTAIVNIAYAIFVFVVLLKKENAEEFG